MIKGFIFAKVAAENERQCYFTTLSFPKHTGVSKGTQCQWWVIGKKVGDESSCWRSEIQANDETNTIMPLSLTSQRNSVQETKCQCVMNNRKKRGGDKSLCWRSEIQANDETIAILLTPLVSRRKLRHSLSLAEEYCCFWLMWHICLQLECCTAWKNGKVKLARFWPWHLIFFVTIDSVDIFQVLGACLNLSKWANISTSLLWISNVKSYQALTCKKKFSCMVVMVPVPTWWRQLLPI